VPIRRTRLQGVLQEAAAREEQPGEAAQEERGGEQAVVAAVKGAVRGGVTSAGRGGVVRKFWGNR
jgi:hypothetical protein